MMNKHSKKIINLSFVLVITMVCLFTSFQTAQAATKTLSASSVTVTQVNVGAPTARISSVGIIGSGSVKSIASSHNYKLTVPYNSSGIATSGLSSTYIYNHSSCKSFYSGGTYVYSTVSSYSATKSAVTVVYGMYMNYASGVTPYNGWCTVKVVYK